eukprot:672405-Pleurochrysis_carterae.AAC.1
MQSPGRRGLTADGQTGLPLLISCPLQCGPSRDSCVTGSHLSAKLVIQNDALNMAKSVASSLRMSLLSAADSSSSMIVGCRVDVHCVNAMATTRALRRIFAADHIVPESVTPQLAEGLD